MLAQADCGTIIYASRNLELDSLLFTLRTLAATDCTDFFRNLTRTITFGARRCLLDIAKNCTHHIGHLAGAAAVVTILQLISRLNSCALTVFASIIKIQGQVYFCAKDGLFKVDLDVGFDIAAAGLALPALIAATLATKKAAENITQAQITKIKIDVLALAAKASKWITAAITADSGMTKLVVALAFLAVF